MHYVQRHHWRPLFPFLFYQLGKYHFTGWIGFEPRFPGVEIDRPFKKMFFNGPTHTSFHVYLSFQTNITILTTNKCENCPSSIRHWDLNSQPSDSESPPLTTRPGLLPVKTVLQFILPKQH